MNNYFLSWDSKSSDQFNQSETLYFIIPIQLALEIQSIPFLKSVYVAQFLPALYDSHLSNFHRQD